MVDRVNSMNPDLSPEKRANSKNIFIKMKDYKLTEISVNVPWHYNKTKVSFPAIISNEQDIISYKRLYANERFGNLETGNAAAQIQNSPHFQEAMDAAEEVIADFENTYIKPVKDAISGESEIELVDLIPTIGVCGMSKIAGKALECLANGVSFDDFLDILISKTFDFMEVNTLGLFLNGLPNSFRQELNEEIEKQFGSGVDISKLLGIKLAEGGGPLKDFVKSSEVAKSAQVLFEKGIDPTYTWTSEELKFLQSQLGKDEAVYEKIKNEMARAYRIDEKVYFLISEGSSITLTIGDKKKEFTKYDKYMRRLIKEEIKKYKTAQSKFEDATARVRDVAKGVEFLPTSSESQDVSNFFPEGTILKRARGVLVERLQTALNTHGFSLEVDGKYEDLTEDAVGQYQIRQGLQIDGDAGPETLGDLGLMAPLESPDTTPLTTETEVAAADTTTSTTDSSGMPDVAAALQDSLAQGGGTYTEVTDPDTNDEIKAANVELNDTPAAPPTVPPGGTPPNTNFIGRAGDFIVDSTTYSLEKGDDELNDFEQAAKSFQETALGVKVDAVFDIIFDFVIDSIMDYFSLDELFEMLRSYPAVDLP